MLLGNTKITAYFEGDCNLGRQRLSASNILLRDLILFQAVEDAKHSQRFSSGAEEGDGQKLPHLELGKNFLPRPGQLRGVVGPQDLAILHGTSQNAFWNHVPGGTVFPFDITPANLNLAVFKQSDKSAA